METLASAPAINTHHLAVGERIFQKFLIEEHLGEGAMGNVYLAQHLVLSTKVAIKVLHPEFCHNDGIRRRFIDEARMMACLRSPHTVRIIDAEISGSQAFLVMEYVQGTNLGNYLAHNKTRGLAVVLDVARQVAIALAEAHALGIVHRDVKPENVLLTSSKSGSLIAKVTDFGVAKRLQSASGVHKTLAGSLLGTPCYMAPEQFLATESVDQRADIFSLGVLIYEMCSGLLPFGGFDVEDILRSVIDGEPIALHAVNSNVPLSLSVLVNECLEKDPNKRLISAQQIAERMRHLLLQLAPERRTQSLLPPPTHRPVLDSHAATALTLTSSAPAVSRRRTVWPLLAMGVCAAGFTVATRVPLDLKAQGRAWGMKGAQTLNLALTEDGLPTTTLSAAARSVPGWDLSVPELPSSPELPSIERSVTSDNPTLDVADHSRPEQHIICYPAAEHEIVPPVGAIAHKNQSSSTLALAAEVAP